MSQPPPVMRLSDMRIQRSGIQWSGLCRSLVLMGGVLVVACGGEPAPARVPEGNTAPPAAAPAAEAAPTSDEAEASESAEPPAPAPAQALPPAPPAASNALKGEDELAQAERELAAADRELSGQGPPAETTAAETAPGRGSGTSKPKSAAAQPKPCATTCKAFASLVRARDSICRIDGSDGERCSRATAIVERHTPRSTSCGCNG